MPVSRILRHTRRGRIPDVGTIRDEAAAVAVQALKTSPRVGRPPRKLDSPAGIRIGAIAPAGEVVRPAGPSRIAPGDRFVLAAIADQVPRVDKMARVGLVPV